MALKAILVYTMFFAMVIFSIMDLPNHTKTVMGNRNISEINLNLQEDEAAVSFLQLSSGESTLIQNKDGTSILINTGAKEARNQLKMHLNIFHVETIDYLILTNFSDFHMGNLRWLIENVNVKRIAVSSSMVNTLKSFLKDKKVQVIPIKEGMKLFPFKNLNIQALHTSGEESDGAAVLLITYGKTKFLYMGLSNNEIETALSKKYNLDTQILKVGYFGIEEGTSQAFLEKVDPQIAIIYNKEDKMPSQDVMERLQAGWIDIYLPNKQGIIVLKCDNENYNVVIIPTREKKFE